VARTDKIPAEPGLPRTYEKPLPWLNALTVRLFTLFRVLIDTVNLLVDGYLLQTAALPTANAQNRGRMVILRGGAGVIDKLYWCRKTAADSYEWKEIV